jgi:hypothetical protein
MVAYPFRGWTEPGLQTLWHFLFSARWREAAILAIGAVSMAKASRSNDWGFPRWRAYGSSRDAEPVRPCDRHGCDEPGDRPAPKSPNSPERWYFCERHAAEYNRNWNYFEGLSAEDAAARETDEQRDANAYRQANHYGWGGPGDGSRSRDEMRALDMLELETDAGFEEIKSAYRRLAKANHPDVKPGDKEAASRFQMIQASYDVLRRAEERRASLSP